MKTAAALGYEVEIAIRSGTGRVTADWKEPKP